MVTNKLKYYYRGGLMYNDRITLSSQEILEKDFKIDARGYNLQEVDKFLDIVIKDYNQYNSIIREIATMNNKLSNENEKLKEEIRNLNNDIEALKFSSENEKEVSNVDLLRRVSQLEKIILGKENN